MHLVQGDRRFSQWKGSVVDSVVGVFLTQNVSDHLSSSAYLSLAARFPLKSNSDQKPVHEEEAVEVCNLELDSEQTTELRNMPYQHVSGQSSMTFQDNDHNADKVVAEGNSSPGIKTADVSLSEIINCCSLNFPETYVQTYNIAPDGMISSQESVTSYQKICECPVAENDERLGSHSQINSEAEKLVNRFQPNGLNDPTSLMDILTMAGSTMLCQDLSRKCENSKDARISGDQSKLTEISTSQCVVQENNQSINHQGEENNKVQQTMNLPNLSVEMGIAESTISEEQKNDEEKAAKDRALKEKNSMKQKSKRVGREISDDFNWDTLRREVEANGKKERQMNTMDSLDWEAVRRADVDEIAETIKDRGMHNQLAARIKAFLNRVVDDHGSIDLEWVRGIEPDKAKEYLLSVNGLGLKSVECIRLLALQHLAFPVDTNVGRIAVRLGWVPLQPLPESLQLHLLELYPVMDSIQKYLWPRLCKLPQKDLYELHYQMITFGKVFCTKRKPNCNACPMRGECRHFASAFASARLALPAPEEKGIVCARAPERTADPVAAVHINALLLPPPQAIQQSEGNLQEEASLRMAPKHRVDPCEPIIELPEEPASPEPESTQYQENDIEDYQENDIKDYQYTDDPDDIPEIKLNVEEFTRNLQCYMENNMELQEGEMSKALVALTPGEASIPMPKLKNVSRLRTEHQVYELPDSHPLLGGMDEREADDPCPYLVAIWTPGETANSINPPEGGCSYQESGKLCDQKTCFACSSILEAKSQIIRGTLLIPCRTATRGRFPLNGTYFQVNEVFADHASSLNPIDIPREWLWKLPRRTVYFATSVTSIFRGLSTDEIQHCFWRGYVCVRGFDRKTRAPRPLVARLHFSASRLAAKQKDKTADG